MATFNLPQFLVNCVFFWGGVNIHETLHGACGFETMEDVTLNWNLLQLEISLSEGIRR